MVASQFIKTRVTPETKARFRALADEQRLTESILLKRLIDLAFAGEKRPLPEEQRPAHRETRDARLYVRLRRDDQMLLRERASARHMPAATYVSVLVRAHLRTLKPLPKEELLALKRTVAELGAIGRNLNQIARAANQSGRVNGPSNQDLHALLKVCQALRDNVKATIKANINSWEIGHVEDES